MPGSDERYRLMIETSQDWFWEFDEHANFTYASPRILDLLGYTPEEVIGQNAFDLMDEAEAERVRKHFDPIARKYLPFNNLLNINLHKDGHEVYIESSGTPIFDDHGTFRGYRGVDRDVTLRKKAELALTQTSQWFSEAQEVARIGIYHFDIPKNSWYGSQTLYQVLGVPGELEHSVDTWLEVIHPNDRETMQTYLLDHVLGQKSGFNRSYRIVRPLDGEVRWVHGRGQLEFDDQGEIISMVGTIQDITDLKSIEENLVEAVRSIKKSKDELNVIISSIADALVVLDGSLNIILFNKAASRMFLQEEGAPPPKKIEDLIPERLFAARLNEHFSLNSDSLSYEFPMPSTLTHTGRIIQTHVATVTVGEEAEFIALFRDVTREREAELLKSEFISTAAHELQTPITSVLGFVELLQNEREYGPFNDTQRKEFLAIIADKSRQISNTVDDLLNLSRIEAGLPILIEKEPCNITEILQKHIATHGLSMAGHRCQVIFHDPLLQVDIDSSKIERVIDNLLSNAVKYSKGKALIEIEGRREGMHFVFRIKDQGIGMTPEQLTRIYDKFYRADSSNTAVSGLGIGMGICRAIIEMHGGEMQVESTPGEGTTVSFTLPLSTAEAPDI